MLHCSTPTWDLRLFAQVCGWSADVSVCWRKHASGEAARVEGLQGTEEAGAGRVVVGLVGYPNVGKSSTINALFGSKKTAVAATPGKTKHFQTLNITDRLTLCDCPGLVLPRSASSKGDLVAAGRPPPFPRPLPPPLPPSLPLLPLPCACARTVSGWAHGACMSHGVSSRIPVCVLVRLGARFNSVHGAGRDGG